MTRHEACISLTCVSHSSCSLLSPLAIAFLMAKGACIRRKCCVKRSLRLNSLPLPSAVLCGHEEQR